MDIIKLVFWTSYLISLYITIFWFLTLLSVKQVTKRKVKISNWPSVAVLIPAYNEEKTIKKCVESVLKLDYPNDKLRIIIINDGSTDNTKKIVEEIIKKHRNRKIVLINQKNSGKAAALNKALKIVNEKFFACLDADSFVAKKTLKRMIRMFYAGDERLAIVTPAMKVNKPRNLLQKMQWIEYLTSMLLHRLMSSLNSVYVAPGPFSVYKTWIVKKLGGFDTKNLAEDQEIAYRMQKHFYDVKQCPNAYVYTSAPYTTLGLYKQRKRWYKGGISNLLKYREMFLNPEYGHFGMVQMPFNMLNFIIAFIAVFLVIYYVVVPLFDRIRDLFIIRFDVKPFLQNLTRNISFTILDVDTTRMFFMLALLSVGLIILFFAFKNAREKMSRATLILLVPYFLLYYLALSFVCVLSIIEMFIMKKQKW